MKTLRRIYGPICKRGQWQKRSSRELEELYNEPNIINIIKYSRLRWVAMLCKWMKLNYLKRYHGQTLEVNDDMGDQNQDGLMG